MNKYLLIIRSIDRSKLIIIAPIVLILVLIITLTVNMPYLDQWELVPMIQHINSDNSVWADIWQQHNEHRILFPNIVLLIIAYTTRWNTQIECLISLVISVASFSLLLKFVRHTALKLKKKVPKLLPLLLSLVWFSPVQIENWLWGWQLEWFLNVGSAVLAFYLLSVITGKNNTDRRYFYLLMIATIVAQYSLGNGIILWPLLFIGLVYKSLNKKAITLTVTAVLGSVIYYLGYVVPTYPSKTLFLEEPVSFIKYVLIYLGRPLTFLRTGALVIGGVLLAIFVVVNLYLFLKAKRKFGLILPWTLLGLYAIGSACLTAISRMGFGLAQAYSSRYTTIAILLLVSVCVSLALSYKDLKPTHVFIKRWNLFPLVVFGVGVLLLSNGAWGIRAGIKHKSALTDIKHCTQQVSPTQNCLLTTYPNSQVVKERLDYLKSIHWAGY